MLGMRCLRFAFAWRIHGSCIFLDSQSFLVIVNELGYGIRFNKGTIFI